MENLQNEYSKKANMISKLDTNHDKTITKEEFLNTNKELRFEKIDTNNDNKISKSEMKAQKNKFSKAHNKSHKDSSKNKQAK